VKVHCEVKENLLKFAAAYLTFQSGPDFEVFQQFIQETISVLKEQAYFFS